MHSHYIVKPNLVLRLGWGFDNIGTQVLLQGTFLIEKKEQTGGREAQTMESNEQTQLKDHQSIVYRISEVEGWVILHSSCEE